jgi:hypothetical protein
MRWYKNSVFEASLKSFKIFMKLASIFFEIRACGAEPVWIKEAEIDLKFLK